MNPLGVMVPSIPQWFLKTVLLYSLSLGLWIIGFSYLGFFFVCRVSQYSALKCENVGVPEISWRSRFKDLSFLLLIPTRSTRFPDMHYALKKN